MDAESQRHWNPATPKGLGGDADGPDTCGNSGEDLEEGGRHLFVRRRSSGGGAIVLGLLRCEPGAGEAGPQAAVTGFPGCRT